MNKSNLITLSPFIFIFLVFFAYLGFILFNIWPIDSKTISQAGVFGDSFGVLTSLFSGLAFAGLLVTIWQQKTDLELTRSEIRDQHFENVLFKMIEIHNSLVTDIDLRKKTTQSEVDSNSNQIIASGRDCFSILYKELTETYNSNDNDNSHNLAYLRAVYSAFITKHNQDLGHYFRYLYNIFKFIDESKAEDKKLYTNIVRAQLSDFELLLLFYNGLQEENPDFKQFIEKYSLLNGIKFDSLINQSHKKMFKLTAFE